MDPMPVVLTPVFDAHLRWAGLRLEGGSAEPLPAALAARLAERWHAAAALPSPHFFLPFDPSWTDSPLPAGQTVLVLPVLPALQGETAAVCGVLRAKGIRLAAPGLPDATLRSLADIAVLPAASAMGELSDETLRQARRGEFQLFAAEADSVEQVEWCAANGFRFIHCRAMAYRPAAKGSTPGSSRVLLLQLLSLVTQDAETPELEHIFKQEPKLAFDLLRLVNSASMGLQTKIASFRQAIAILGRRQLRRWLQLLLFAPQKEGAGGQGILMQQAAARGRLMELLIAETLPGLSLDYREQAFMVGLFSMLDTLMGMPLAELLPPLRLVEPVEHALLAREGELGRLLALVEQAEARDMDGLGRSLLQLGVSDTAFNDAQAATLAWVYRLGVSINS